MFRHLFLVLVASIFLFSCKNNSNNTQNWEKVYTNAYKNHDYQTAIVALNNLVLTDSTNKNIYDSLANYYLEKTQNYNAGKNAVDKGLALNADNFKLLEYKAKLILPEGKLKEAREMFEKAYKISNLNKYKYMQATTWINENNFIEADRIINELLYSNSKPEFIESPVSQYESQNVNIKALCYGYKAKVAFGEKNMLLGDKCLDSALNIQPDYQEALAIKEQLHGKK